MNRISSISELEKTEIPGTIPELLRQQVDLTPNRKALVFFDQDKELTYEELDYQVRSIANGLRQSGVRKGTHIGLMLPNCIEFPVTWLAIAWIGAVSVQLNPKFVPNELNYVLNDADIDFLILDVGGLSSVAALEDRPTNLLDKNIIVCGSTFDKNRFTSWTNLLAYEALQKIPEKEQAPTDLISILYTSGTTGFPKGCMLDHRYWVQIGVIGLFYQGGNKPRNALIHEPLFYIQGNAILIISFLSNATVYLPDTPSVNKFLSWVHSYKIDYCALPVPVVHSMEDHPSKFGKSLKWVHTFYFHGDWLKRIEDRFNLIGRDSYAMTENGLCTYVPVDRPDLAKNGSIGVTAPWREIRIVDNEGNDVTDGEVGEVWTAGPGHFHGYYRKPEINKQSFHGRWFRTGDLVRKDADGGFYLIGRKKEIIKRSGENISSAEVESCICKLPGVAMAAAIPVPHKIRGEEVKVYVKLANKLNKNTITPKMIFDHFSKNLSQYKVPRYLTYVRSFPMTVSDDKVAKTKLIDNVEDLTIGAFDRESGIWR